jgi:hypothetical protein
LTDHGGAAFSLLFEKEAMETLQFGMVEFLEKPFALERLV